MAWFYRELPWLYLVLAGVCEMAWPVGYKYTGGFTRNWPMIGLTVAVMVVSFLLMMAATKTLHVGTAYAVWTGLGAAGTAALGIFLLNEPRDVMRVLCIVLVVAGVVGLRLFSPEGGGTANPKAPPANMEH